MKKSFIILLLYQAGAQQSFEIVSKSQKSIFK